MSDKAFVLIVAPDEAEGESVAATLHKSGHVCKTVASVDEAAASIRVRPPDVVIADYDSGAEAERILRDAKKKSPDTEVIFAADDRVRASAEALVCDAGAGGAFGVIVKPLVDADVRTLVDRAVRRVVMGRQDRLLHEQFEKAFNFEGIISSSDALAREIRRVTKLAPTKCTILIVGESGTGKELIARAVHVHSPRKDKPFLTVNCPSLSETLLESELFGHVRGAFTGAVSDRKGVLESADGGTLFLDEIGDMSLAMQAKILRAVENGEVMRVGSNEVRHVDLRFVAATHRDLWELVEDKKFREDLFYRLHGHGAIRLPPLRNRREDIPLLVHHFIELTCRENGQHPRHVTPEAMRKLSNHSWRGNVRELKAVVERMIAEAEADPMGMEDLPEQIRGSTDIVPAAVPTLAGLSMADVERLHILNTLKLTGGNRERAAAVLKIGARTLYRKLKDYGVT